MEKAAEEIPEKLRVSKTGIIVLFCVLLDRYSTAGVSCKLHNHLNLNLV